MISFFKWYSSIEISSSSNVWKYWWQLLFFITKWSHFFQHWPRRTAKVLFFVDWYLRLLEGPGLGCRSRLSDFKASILVDLAFWTWDAASCSAVEALDEGCCCCCSLIDLVFDGGLECGCGVLVVFNVAKFEVKNMRQKEETKERKIIWQH